MDDIETSYDVQETHASTLYSRTGAHTFLVATDPDADHTFYTDDELYIDETAFDEMKHLNHRKPDISEVEDGNNPIQWLKNREKQLKADTYLDAHSEGHSTDLDELYNTIQTETYKDTWTNRFLYLGTNLGAGIAAAGGMVAALTFPGLFGDSMTDMMLTGTGSGLSFLVPTSLYLTKKETKDRQRHNGLIDAYEEQAAQELREELEDYSIGLSSSDGIDLLNTIDDEIDPGFDEQYWAFLDD